MRKVSSMGMTLLLLFVSFFVGLNGFYAKAASDSNDITFKSYNNKMSIGTTQIIEANIYPASGNNLSWEIIQGADKVRVTELGKGKENGTGYVRLQVEAVGPNQGTVQIGVFHANGKDKGQGNQYATCSITIGPANTSAISLQGEVKNVTSGGKEVSPNPQNTYTVTKGLDGSPAKAEVNYQLTPSGKLESVLRKPVDVVFIFDTSGSMTQSRLTKARQAAQNAINRFNVPGDQVGLVSFSTEVNTSLALTTNFSTIKSKIDTFTKGNGGTNYTSALSKAKDILSSSSKPQNEKYIIFMTDGEPTVQGTTNKDYANKGYYDVLLTKAAYIGKEDSRGWNYVVALDYSATEKSIRERAKNTALSLKSANIKLHSIGLEITDSTDRAYLKSLSDATGGTTMQGTEDELDKMFNSVVNQINNVNLTDVKIQVKLTNGVTVDTAKYPNVTTQVIGNDRYAVIAVNPIAFNAAGPISASNPNGLSSEQIQQIEANLRQTLPLLFSEAGEYVFDKAHNNEMVLKYVDVNGQTVTKDVPAIKVIVVDPRIPATGLVLDKLDMELEVDPYAGPGYTKHEKTLTATIVPSNATSQTIQWTPKDPSIVEVVGSGKTVTIRAKRPGKTEIVAQVNEKLANGQQLPPATCNVRVNLHPVFNGKSEVIHDGLYAFVVPKKHTVLPDPGASMNNDALETRWYLRLSDGTWHSLQEDAQTIKGYFDRKDIFYKLPGDKNAIPFGVWALTVDKTLPPSLGPEEIVTAYKGSVFGELRKATIEDLQRDDITNFIAPVDKGSSSSNADNRAGKVMAGYQILKLPATTNMRIQKAELHLVPVLNDGAHPEKASIISLGMPDGNISSSILQSGNQAVFVKSKLLKAPGKSIKYNMVVKMLVKLESRSDGFDFTKAPASVIKEIPIEKMVGSIQVKGSDNLN